MSTNSYDNILDIDTKSVRCFLCDKAFVSGDKSFLLFSERSTSECSLALVLGMALGTDVAESTAHSSLLCSQCNDILLDYERVDQQLYQLRMTIFNSYNLTTMHLKELEEKSLLDENNDNYEDYVITEYQQPPLEIERTLNDSPNDMRDIIYEETNESEYSESSNNNLVEEAIELNGLQFHCEVCHRCFVDGNSLSAHKQTQHKTSSTNQDSNVRKRPFSCSVCGKTFARRAEVADHERIHTGHRPFKCDLCELSFTQRSNLLTHKKTTHFNEEQYKCDMCERTFKRRRLLVYHTRSVHTGERPHKCELCNSSFVHPEQFKKHLRTHTGERPFACEVCGKLFNSRDNRNTHRFVHSDKKLYECMACGAGFMRKPHLLAHMKRLSHNCDTIIMNQPQIKGKTINKDFVPLKTIIKCETAQTAAESESPTEQCSILGI